MDIDFSTFEREFTGSEKLRAFLHHLWILTFGAVLQPEKSKCYVEVFDEFIKQKKQGGKEED